jgi:hypothetical protein
VLELITDKLSKTEDEFDVFGKMMAMKLRSMSQGQRLLAEKLMHEVAFMGQSDKIMPATTVHTQPVYRILSKNVQKPV